MRADTPDACAKKCYGISSMFLQGYEECWCQLSSKNGVCDEQVDNLADKDGKKDVKNPEFKLYKYKVMLIEIPIKKTG